MDRDDIIKMAKQAKLPYEYDTGRILNLKQIERFAELVAAHEREACAKLCDEKVDAEEPVECMCGICKLGKREWVGLTEDEIDEIIGYVDPHCQEEQFARAIEAKLKEKNHG